MKKIALTTLLLASGMLTTTAAMATTASYQYCSISGCRTGGTQAISSTYAKTKYPVILAHGMGGFTAILGIEYFYGIGPNLTANGAKVFETQVASFNTSYVRGEQLLNQTQQILAITGAAKVNIIAHSQGAQDSRYVAAIIPSKIASVTSVGGVNAGTPVADLVAAVAKSPAGSTIAPLISTGVNAFFNLVGVASGKGYSQDTLAGLNQLTTAGTAAFNAKFPAGLPTANCGQGAAVANGIHFYSWGGTSKLTNFFDISDPILAVTGSLVSGASDGLVPKCATHLGQVIRDDYSQNHFDEVNQIFGLVYMFQASPVTLYRQQANRLQLAGL